MNDFLSKENTINIFKSIITLNNLTNLNKQQKDNLINQIISIMKKVYKTLEFQKINKNNLPVVKKQYNDIIIKQTSEIYKENNNQNKTNNDRQNDRTFNSIKKTVPIPGADRPSSNSFAGQNFGSAPPISADFMKKATEDINTRLAEIENSRRSTQEKPKPTELPDFLKPQKVGKTSNDIMQQSKPMDSKPLLGFNDVMDSNFSSSVPSSDKSKYTEQLSTMDRLKQLKMERNMTPSAPVQNTNNNLNTMFNNNNNMNTMFSNNNLPVPPQQLPPQQFQPQQFQPQQFQPQQIPPQQIPPPQLPQQFQPQHHYQPQDSSQNGYQELLNKMNEMQQTIRMLKQENELIRESNQYQKKNFTEELQLEINKKDSRYNYQFNLINNISNIKLISYQLPPPMYNILEDSALLYKYNNMDKQIFIQRGNYNITNLLQKLNENSDLTFTTNIEEKIVIKSIDNETPFQLLYNSFANKLGFNNNENYVLTLLAERIYDIRHINKLYFYIRNIYQDKPVGILNFNGSSICNMVFNNKISLSNLLLEFYTEDNILYNFNNMNYNLSFIIETTN